MHELTNADHMPKRAVLGPSESYEVVRGTWTEII